MHFIRHGQSEFNIAMNQTGRDPGIIDAPLTEQGRAQALAAAHKLAAHPITHLITSPYTRALQTASIIAEHIGASIHVEPLAGERCIYACDVGTPTSQLRKLWPQVDFSSVVEEKWWPELEEGHSSLEQRVQKFRGKWQDVLRKGQTGLVSHWYFLNSLTGHAFENGQVLTKLL